MSPWKLEFEQKLRLTQANFFIRLENLKIQIHFSKLEFDHVLWDPYILAAR